MGRWQQILKPLCACLMLAIMPGGSALADADATLNISILGTTECAVTGGTFPLGTYTGAEVNTTINVGVACSGGLGWSLAFDAGNNSFGSGVRSLAGPSNLLIYYLIDPSTSNLLGDGGTTISGFQITGSTVGQIPINVLVPDVAAQNAAVTPGNYTDTVTLTLTF